MEGKHSFQWKSIVACNIEKEGTYSSILLLWCPISVVSNLCWNDDVNTMFLSKIFTVAFKTGAALNGDLASFAKNMVVTFSFQVKLGWRVFGTFGWNHTSSMKACYVFRVCSKLVKFQFRVNYPFISMYFSASFCISFPSRYWFLSSPFLKNNQYLSIRNEH